MAHQSLVGCTKDGLRRNSLVSRASWVLCLFTSAFDSRQADRLTPVFTGGPLRRQRIQALMKACLL